MRFKYHGQNYCQQDSGAVNINSKIMPIADFPENLSPCPESGLQEFIII